MSRLRCGPRKLGIAQNPHDRSHPSAIFAGALLALVALSAFLAPLITPQNPYDLAALVLWLGFGGRSEFVASDGPYSPVVYVSGWLALLGLVAATWLTVGFFGGAIRRTDDDGSDARCFLDASLDRASSPLRCRHAVRC